MFVSKEGKRVCVRKQCVCVRKGGKCVCVCERANSVCVEGVKRERVCVCV